MFLAFSFPNTRTFLKQEKRPPSQVKQEPLYKKMDDREEEEEENEELEEEAAGGDDDYIRPKPRKTKASGRRQRRPAHRPSHSRKRQERQQEEDSLDGLPEEVYAKRTCRTRSTVSYQFKEYDDLIKSAIEEDLSEPKPPRPPRPPGV